MRSVLLALLVLAAGCGPSPCDPRVPVAVPTAPPAPLDEPDSKAPIAPGLAQIKGHWHWDGHRWLWMTTRWSSVPAGQRWYPPRYGTDGEGRPEYRAGAFGCADGDDD